MSCVWHALSQCEGPKQFGDWVGYSRDNFNSHVNIIQNNIGLNLSPYCSIPSDRVVKAIYIDPGHSGCLFTFSLASPFEPFNRGCNFRQVKLHS